VSVVTFTSNVVRIETYDGLGRVITLGTQGPPGPPGDVGPTGPAGLDGNGVAYYGQMSSQTPHVVNVENSGVYYPLGYDGVFDVEQSFGTAAPEDAAFGIRNVSGETVLFVIVATADVQIGNNRTAGFRLAVNGVPIPETTCSATTGTANFAKVMTQWFVTLDDGDEVTPVIANLTDSNNITVVRSKIIAFTPGRQSEPNFSLPGGIQITDLQPGDILMFDGVVWRNVHYGVLQ